MKMQVHDNFGRSFCQYAGYWKEKKIRIKWMNSYLH